MQGLGKLTGSIVTRNKTADKTEHRADLPGHQQAGVSGRGHGVSLGAWVRLILICLVIVTLLPANWQAPADPVDSALLALTQPYRFDLIDWEVGAIAGKVADLFRRPAAGLTTEEGQALVYAYLRLGQRAGELERQIEETYANPAQDRPDAATRGRRAELAALRKQLAEQASIVEAVLQDQTARILARGGLTSAGLVWPPPRFRFTEPPQLLVVSRRDRIERLRSIDLIPDLDSSDRDQLEQAAAGHDVSAYVTPIGGYGVWPTLVVDRFSLAWTLETIAHEWVHNYLAFQPLGMAMLTSRGGDVITMNETVASIVGEELGQMALEAYYSSPIQPFPVEVEPDGERVEALALPQKFSEPPAFDFGKEMRATRLAVDAILEKGYVEEAEAFMEARRRRFVEQGYRLRVLNQAYFAFHGSYATGPSATDPIGPELERLRELSPSLVVFLRTVDDMTTVAEIDAALAELETG